MEITFNDNFIISESDNDRIHKSDIFSIFESFRLEDETDTRFLNRLKKFLLNKEGIDWSPNLRVKGEKLKGVFLGIRRKTSKDVNLINLEEELPVKPLIDLSEPTAENKVIKVEEDNKTKYKDFERLSEDKQLSKSTITRYQKCLKKLETVAKEEDLKIDYDKQEETIELIDEAVGDLDYKGRERADSQKASLRANYVKAIIWYLKEKKMYSNPLKYEKYLQLMRNSKKQYLDERAENVKNEKEVDVWINWEDVLKIRDELEEKATQTKKKTYWKKTLLISLYTLFPPRRALDYKEMVVIKDIKDDEIKDLDENKNYYVRQRKLFIFKRYKTSKFYGTQVFKVNEQLSNIIENYLKFILDLEEGDSLLHLKSENGLIQAVEKIMGHKGFTINIFRKSFLSYKEKTGYRDLNERKQISEMMAHSIMQQLEYAKK